MNDPHAKNCTCQTCLEPLVVAHQFAQQHVQELAQRIARPTAPSKLPVLYLAHPVSGDVPGNVARAKRWLRWACRAFGACAVIAPWIQAIELGEDDSNPVQRELGLRRDEAIAARCDAVLLVGGRRSSGMAREASVARAVIDMTMLGDEPPEVA